DEQTSSHANHFIDECLRIVRSAIPDGKQGDRRVTDLWGHAADVAATLVRRGSHYAPITVLMIGRLAAEQGLVSAMDWDEKYVLSTYPADMKALGRVAIECEDT